MELQQRPRIINIDAKRNDKPGALYPIECYEVGFQFKRAFFIRDFGDNDFDKIRGNHGHTEASEFIVCTAGSCTIDLIYRFDPGDTKDGGMYHWTLDKCDIGLLVPPNFEIRMSQFSPDCCLMVLCDRHYKDDKTYTHHHQSK